MESSRELASMDAAELRSLAATLYAQLAERDTERSAHAALVAELKAKQLKIDQLTHERPRIRQKLSTATIFTVMIAWSML